MIAVSKTVVYVDTMVIEFLYTALAIGAVECIVRLYDFAVETEVL